MGLSARVLLIAFGVLTALGVASLLFGATRTAQFFAWTISPPLSAAFLGSGYAAGCLLVLLTLRADRWRTARIPLITIFVFTLLTLIASVKHADRMHWATGGLATLAAWVWMAVYVLTPIAIASVLIVGELSGRGRTVLPRRRHVPVWARAVLIVQGLLMLAAGVGLYVSLPSLFAAWPWQLTPLPARVIAAWLVAFGIAALTLTRSSIASLTPSAAAYGAFGVLELLVLVLYSGNLRSPAATAAYAVFLVSVVAISLWGMASARKEI